MTEDIGSLRVSLALDGSDFNKSMASVDRNIKALSQEMSIIRAKGNEWGKSTEGLGVKQETLSRLMEAQGLKVKKLNEQYQRAAKEQGENSKEAENLAIKLNKAAAEYTRTEKELNDVTTALGAQQGELRQTDSKWKDLSKTVVSSGDRMKEAGDKIKGIGEKLTVGISAPLAAAGFASGKLANDFQQAQGKLRAQLGLTEKEAERLSEVAQDVWQNAFGESLVEVGDNLAFVKQTLKGLTDNELKEFVEGAYTIKDAFGAEINETTRTSSVLMKNFGIDGKKSLDLITVGFQKGGNFSDELLDTLREYAPQFKGMGFDADEFLAILISGAEKGAFNLDKVGDAAKEAFLRIGDGSSSSRDALKEVGLDFQQIEKDINSGGDSAKTAFAAVVSSIASIEDPAKKAQTAVALLGTPIEDLGPEFQDFFNDVNYDLGKVEGATNDAKDALYDSFGSRLQGELRKFQAELEPAGEILLDIAEEWLPRLSESAQDALKWFEELGPEGQETALKIAAIAAAAGPAAVAIGSVSSGVGGLLKVVGPALPLLGKGTGMVGIVGALSSPLGLAALGVAGLTAAIGLGVKAYKESNDVNLEAIETKQKEIEKNDQLIKRFDDLSIKNKLSNDEMLTFLDLQQQLKSTGAPDEITKLKDAQDKLLEKSGLTNDEMEEYLGLNDKIIEKAPDTQKSVSDLGQVFIDNTNALKGYNEEQRKQLEIEAYEAVKVSLEQQNQLLNDRESTTSRIKDLNQQLVDQQTIITDGLNQVREQEALVLDLEKEKESTNGTQLIQLQSKIDREKAILADLQTNLGVEKERETTLGNQLGKQREKLDEIAEELRLSEEARFKYEEIILANAGITAEKGRGLLKIDEEISKLKHEKAILDNLLAAGKIGTAEYNAQNSKLDTQLGKLREAQGELQYVNELAGRTVYKNIVMQSNPSIEEFNRALRQPITRYVNVITSGNPVPAYATGTRSAVGGMSLVGEQGPELMYVPQGSRIIPNNDTIDILRKWNVPATTSSNGSSNSSQTIHLVVDAPIFMDGNEVGRAVVDEVTFIQEMNGNVIRKMGGG